MKETADDSAHKGNKLDDWVEEVAMGIYDGLWVSWDERLSITHRKMPWNFKASTQTGRFIVARTSSWPRLLQRIVECVSSFE